MAIIAVVNRKGGSGKSMLATHIASYLASLGQEVMLGDVDRQQSSRLWLGLRPHDQPKIRSWIIDERNFARPPAGVKHVVLDTPAGFHGLGLMKVALYADAILVPVTPSLFDRRAAADSIKELRTLPRVATGKCQIACVGLRIDARTRNDIVLKDWADELGIAYLGAIRQLQVYQRCVEQGLSLFDLPQDKFAPYLQEWVAITAWLSDILSPPAPLPDTRALVRTVPIALSNASITGKTSAAGTSDGVAAQPFVVPPPAEEIPTFLRRLISRVL